MFNLLSLAENDTTLKRSGAYYIGPCPFCGGKDRFNLKVDGDRQAWFCRQCGGGKYHDAADYLMRRENITYPEALARMGEKPAPRERIRPSEPEIYSEQPCAGWRDRAEQFVLDCQDALWSPVGVRALDWLRKRGLTDDTLRKYLVGYNPADRAENYAAWGGPENKQVMLYGGITLPAITDYPDLREDGHRETERVEVEYIKIRRPVVGDKERKYVKVTGSKPGVFGHWNLRGAEYIVVTEGEFDCMILDQAAGDLVGVCTFGSSTDKPHHCRPALWSWQKHALVLVAYDNDEAGMKGADDFIGQWPVSKIISLPDEYNDINDAHLAGLELGGWLVKEIDRLGIELEEVK